MKYDSSIFITVAVVCEFNIVVRSAVVVVTSNLRYFYHYHLRVYLRRNAIFLIEKLHWHHLTL